MEYNVGSAQIVNNIVNDVAMTVHQMHQLMRPLDFLFLLLLLEPMVVRVLSGMMEVLSILLLQLELITMLSTLILPTIIE